MFAFKNPVYKTTVTVKGHESDYKSLSEKAVYKEGERVTDVIESLKSTYGSNLISIDSVELVEFIRVMK